MKLYKAIKYIWYIVIKIVVHECTHNERIYLTDRQHSIGNY